MAAAGVIQRKALCNLCNGARGVSWDGERRPVLLCAYQKGMVCNMQTYRGTPVMRDAVRPGRVSR